jgi:Putative Ig domain
MSFLVRAAVAAASRKTARVPSGFIPPQVLSTTFTATSATVTSHTVNMPAEVDTGDLLICTFSLNPTVSSPTITTPSGWTFLGQLGGDPVNWKAYKISDGSEGGGSINVSSSSAGHGVGIVTRIKKDTFDLTKPPELSGSVPSWGYGDTLWLANASIDRDPSVTSYPLTDNQGKLSTTGGSASDRSTAAICTQIMETADSNDYVVSPNFTVTDTRIAVAPTEIVFSFTDPYPDGVVGDGYDTFSDLPVTRNGQAPFTYSVFSGSLPPGIELVNTSTGYLSGFPTTVGSFTFTLRCTDDDGLIADRSVTIEVEKLPLEVSGTYADTGTVGEDYFQNPTFSHGLPPYAFTVHAGSLPSGLTLDAESGFIAGLPLVEGVQGGFTIRCTDDDGDHVDVVVASFTTDKQPLAVEGEYPDGVKDEPYGGSVFFHAGQPPYVVTLLSGTLPPGLSIEPDFGDITGTPTTVGTYSFTVRCTDDDGNDLDLPDSIEITL